MNQISFKQNIHTIKASFETQGSLDNLQRLKDSSPKDRLVKLRKIEKYLLREENQSNLYAALKADLSKPAEESLSTELVPILTSLTHIKRNVRTWMKDKRVGSILGLAGINSRIRYEPKGQVLIFSPWNYPFQLAINPLLYSIAAGNASIIKPSEMAPQTSSFIKKMMDELFDESEVKVIEGGVSTATALLKLPFNHLFFTGSPKVGKVVMEAAARNLCSVTLELGGKSPVIIDSSANVGMAAQKIAWGKCLNVGQTCVAPDYVLIHASHLDRFKQGFIDTVKAFYQKEHDSIEESPYYGRIVDEKNAERLNKLLDKAIGGGAKVAWEGKRAGRFMAPVLLENVNWNMQIMKEEIFGPILPIIPFDDLEDALQFINRLPAALSMYMFSQRKDQVQKVLQHTRSGGFALNELMITSINPKLPFGGVNNSGIGKSNGRRSFEDFSNERGVMVRKWLDWRMLYPPFKKNIFKNLTKVARL
ncbi:MAG: aldehyde dehydrogenase family protein [Bacteroidia bacterium]|nr:aldehyde dehydrogenase family protein [Bacteroidia bacterium]